MIRAAISLHRHGHGRSPGAYTVEVMKDSDWKEIVRRLDSIQANQKIILTTEKDAVRLIKFAQELKDYPLYVIPIEVQFLFGEEQQFTDLISKFIDEFRLII